jgi:predicted  nucleic acid-binding Zn-ribbon protein
MTTRGSTDSHKRKSVDPSDAENHSPNQEPAEEKIVAKKSRFGLRSASQSIPSEGITQDKQSSKSSLSSTMMKARSALPRYTSTKSVSVAESKRRAATEKTTAERAPPPTTPSRAPPQSSSSPPRTVSSAATPKGNSARTSIGKMSASRRKSTRKSILKINGGKIKHFFEACGLIDEDKINETIVPKLRVKCKWDYRDKANRQTEVITDLKNAYKQNLVEVKSLQEKCESEEKILQEVIYDLRNELQETLQLNAELKRNEIQLKKDYARISNEYNSCNSKFKALEKEMPSLLRELDFLKQKSDETENELRGVTQTLLTKETLLADLSSQLKSLNADRNELSSSMKDQIDQATEKYRQDILDLRIELEKRQYDVEKTSAEREDMQEKAESHKEIVMRLESSLRETESLARRLEKEEIKLGTEVTDLKAQLAQKDGDLRMTLASMQEYQRNFTEERATLRSELRSHFSNS